MYVCIMYIYIERNVARRSGLPMTSRIGIAIINESFYIYMYLLALGYAGECTKAELPIVTEGLYSIWRAGVICQCRERIKSDSL